MVENVLPLDDNFYCFNMQDGDLADIDRLINDNIICPNFICTGNTMALEPILNDQETVL